MPTTDDYDKRMEKQERDESRLRAFFKVVGILFWVLLTIIVVIACLVLAWATGYFS